jgi:hypothetical protein
MASLSVSVRPQYTRSVNVERDFETESIVGSYIPTARAITTLERMIDTLVSSATPRAWSLVGPYGSGKSSFAVFLANLLAEPSDGGAAIARKVLANAHPDLGRRIQRELKGTRGFCRVLLTGSPEPMGRRLAHALRDGAANFWGSRRGPSPRVVKNLEALVASPEIEASTVLALLKDLQAAVSKAGGRGVLLIIDELGKFLEYEARHYGANDIFLLQSIAELAYQNSPAPILCVALLHQSFEQYAQGLGESLRNEWSKVQGRFETIPFLEAAEQVLRIVAAAFEADLSSADRRSVRAEVARITKALESSGALPAGLRGEQALDLFASCYPLHPLAALMLPTLCQRVAQNERTLFSYLGSHEPSGFRDSLSRLPAGGWVMPAHVYDYFILNQPRLTTDLATQRRWVEVITAVDRLGDGTDQEVAVLKTVGLLNIIGAHAGLKASREIIDLLAEGGRGGRKLAEQLVKKSILQYRKFSGEYRVWQGSDFDLDQAVEDEKAALGKFSVADVMTSRQAFDPIVVRRHTIRSGALRYFDPVFTDAASWSRLDRDAALPRVILFLAEGQDDVGLFEEKVQEAFGPSDVLALVPGGAYLREVAGESLALERVQATREALSADPVAKREFKDRYEAALEAEGRAVGSILDVPEVQRWYWQGELLPVASARNLQEQLSRVLDAVYESSPVFRNELINRDQPSSTANAARNKLLQALLRHGDKADLAIDKFPAEKAMYLALLKSTGLHRPTTDGSWKLQGPDPARDPCNLLPMWRQIDDFLAESESGALPLSVLGDVLSKPPFGVKAGVLPIIYTLAALVHQQELALYEDGNYVPFLTEELVERLARRPETFSVQRFRLEGLRADLFKEYAQAIHGDAEKSASLLSIAQPLVQFVNGLPEYSRKTKTVSKKAQDIRTAVQFSRSPATLLFRDLPLACGYPDLSGRDVADTTLEGFAESLLHGLRELKGAYPALLASQQAALKAAVSAPGSQTIGDLRKLLVGRYAGLERYTVDVDELAAFIRRLTSDESDDQLWFDKLLLFLGRKPASKWEDRDRTSAEFRLSDFARRLNDLEKLRVHREGERHKRGDEFSVILLRSAEQGETDVEAFAVIEARQRAHVASAAKLVRERLAEAGDPQFQLAVLATVVNQVLGALPGPDSLVDRSGVRQSKESSDV